MNKYPKTITTPETRIDVEEKRKFQIMDEIKNRLNNTKDEVIEIDGVRVQNSNGWFLIRASNTQNQLTCRAEAADKESLISLTNLIEEHLLLSGVTYNFILE